MNMESSVSQGSSPSKSDGRRRGSGWLRLARFAPGPLALAGFFLPWAEGPGALAGTSFSGFALVGFAGRLQALDLSATEGGTLWMARLAILGLAIAATWQTLLSPAHRAHAGYRLSGWYLVGAAAVLLAIGLGRSGLVIPPPGLALISIAAVVFIASVMYELRTPVGEELDERAPVRG